MKIITCNFDWLSAHRNGHIVNGQVTAPAIASEDQNAWRSTLNSMDFDVQKIILRVLCQ